MGRADGAAAGAVIFAWTGERRRCLRVGPGAVVARFCESLDPSTDTAPRLEAWAIGADSSHAFMVFGLGACGLCAWRGSSSPAGGGGVSKGGLGGLKKKKKKKKK